MEKAKSLFKAAGVAGNTFVLPTANVLPGMIESSTIWAQQAKAAGHQHRVEGLAAGNYWTTAGGAYVRPFCLQVAQPIPSLTGAVPLADPVRCAVLGHPLGRSSPPGAPEPTTSSWPPRPPPTPAKAADLWHQVQQQQVTEGGYVVWGLAPYIDFAGNNVRGLTASSAFNFNNWRFQDGWIAQVTPTRPH